MTFAVFLEHTNSCIVTDNRTQIVSITTPVMTERMHIIIGRLIATATKHLLLEECVNKIV